MAKISISKRLYMAACNNRYGDQAFLPLAAGLMWAYARQQPGITDAYEMCGMLFAKEPVERAADRLERPDVLALSSYIWNHEWNKALAREVKRRWPSCAILVGGVQVPEESPRALEECEAFDFAIYGEGEGAFADFLRVCAAYYLGKDQLSWDEVWGMGCGSLVWRSEHGGIVVNPRHVETPIEDIPSPYLEGLFDDIIAANPHTKFQALQETNRGCYARCSFCAWGSALKDKMTKFPIERVLAEYEWFANNKIELLYNADSNFGMYKRDIELTEELVKTKHKYGYPKLFRAAYAKNSNDVVFNISKMLADAGMLKATTLALQSEDEGVLVNIKRKNIKHDKFAELSRRYEEAGIATYVELIVGLPGETYDSFVAGIDRVLDAGQHDSLAIYLCMLLENTEMAKPEHRKEHGIESVPMKALLYHGTPEPGVPEEIQETVVATATMPREQLTRAVLHSWLVQALHSLGLTQYLARRLRDEGIAYKLFYQMAREWAEEYPRTALGGALTAAMKSWAGVSAEQSWDTVDARFGEVMWPPEELLFLHLAVDSERFYDEAARMLVFMFGSDDVLPIAREALEEQRALFIPPEPGKLVEYAREAVWYGRKSMTGKKLRLRK